MSAAAHPLGNFTINHYDGIRVAVDSVLIDHVVDMAEIPTFRERAAMDTDGDGAVSDAEAAAYQATACDAARSQLDLRCRRHLPAARGHAARPVLPDGPGRPDDPARVRLPGGAAGRPGRHRRRRSRSGTPRTATASAGARSWSRATALTLAGSDAPATGISDRLTHYPTDLLSTPSAQTSAAWSAVAGGAALGRLRGPGRAAHRQHRAPRSAPRTRPTAAVPNGISELGADVAAIFQAKELTLPVILLSMLAAAGLGALHAVSPGHGKTVMAAYLVGSRGTSRQALGLGMTVTVSHTLGVLALGALSLFAASIIPPERLYPILGIVSGAIVIGIGTWLVLGRVRIIRRERAEARAHAPRPRAWPTPAGPHTTMSTSTTTSTSTSTSTTSRARPRPRPVDDGWHSHGGMRHTHLPPAGSSLSMRGLFALGLAGGMVPSVSALILLLGSISLGRPAYGIALTVAFGVGMAVVLVGVGVALVHARGLLDRIPARSAGCASVRCPPRPRSSCSAPVLITTQAALTLR